MQSENLNSYITKRYDRWLDYAMYHCRRSGLNLEPAEVLNDVLCQLLQRNPVKLERLLNERRDKYARLDYLVLRVIRISVISPRSHVRYTKGQHCTRTVDWDLSGLSEVPATESEEIDPDSRLREIRAALDDLDAPQWEKEVFAWKFFEGKSLLQWPGTEHIRRLRRIYNRIFLKISCKMKVKNDF